MDLEPKQNTSSITPKKQETGLDIEALDEQRIIDEMFQTEQKSQKRANDKLKEYYKQVFPFDLIERWLCYFNDPKSKNPDESSFFARREFSFTLENDIYIRYQYCHDRNELKEKIIKFNPQKIDIGAVFFSTPKSSTFGFSNDDENTLAKPVEREFIIDIDMDEYNAVRTCCQDANVCPRCWKFMQAACTVLDKALKDDFGFELVAWFFSGRRGIHAWICDERARDMTNEARGAVAEYLRIVAGNEKTGARVEGLNAPLHPHIARSVRLLEKRFVDIVIEEQNIFEQNEHVEKILGILKERFALSEERLKEYKRKVFLSSDDPAKKFEVLKKLIEADEPAERRKRKFVLEELILYYLYPRIDINVSKGMNHLLKSPFCVHPKSKKVSVPILDFKTFDPSKAPTIDQIVSENGNGSLSVNLKIMAPYFDFFESFIARTEKSAKIYKMAQKKDNKMEQEKSLDF